MNLYGVAMWGDHYTMIPCIISLLTLVTKNIKKTMKNPPKIEHQRQGCKNI